MNYKLHDILVEVWLNEIYGSRSSQTANNVWNPNLDLYAITSIFRHFQAGIVLSGVLCFLGESFSYSSSTKNSLSLVVASVTVCTRPPEGIIAQPWPVMCCCGAARNHYESSPLLFYFMLFILYIISQRCVQDYGTCGVFIFPAPHEKGHGILMYNLYCFL